MGAAGGMGCEYSEFMGGTSGYGIVSSTYDVLEMSVVRGVDGLHKMCMCLARGGVGVGVVCHDQVRCCCLPTPMTLASGGSPMFPLVVHQPASPSLRPAVQSLRRGLSTKPGATMWCVCGCS